MIYGETKLNPTSMITTLTRTILALSVILLFSVFQPIFAQKQSVFFPHASLKEAFARGQQQGKLIFMVVQTKWCEPCPKLEKVWGHQDLAQHFNHHFVNIMIDMESPEGKQLAEAMHINALPAMFFLEPNGNIVHKSVGVKDYEAMMSFAKNALIRSTQGVIGKNELVTLTPNK
jgi:thioredoxin-related protein